MIFVSSQKIPRKGSSNPTENLGKCGFAFSTELCYGCLTTMEETLYKFNNDPKSSQELTMSVLLLYIEYAWTTYIGIINMQNAMKLDK